MEPLGSAPMPPCGDGCTLREAEPSRGIPADVACQYITGAGSGQDTRTGRVDPYRFASNERVRALKEGRAP